MRFASALAAGLLAGVSSARAVEQRATANKPVFAHYMIGEITDAHTRQDIIDAKALGLDAFAMNFDQFAYWSNNTVDRLFNNADELGFGLFFSFDHAAGHLKDPSQYADYLKNYISRKSYFRLNNKPLVSTFGGENVYTWADFKKTVGDVLVVPGYYQIDPTKAFSDHQNIDGVFNWNSWPQTSAGKVVVPTNDDKIFQSKAKAASKLFMMGISPIQFKHLDSGNNWYRRGEDNLEYRLGQVLDLQPDMLQLQTWNDAGESHYMGNLWDEPMSTSAAIQAQVKDRDHKGYWQILPAFIQAWKRGDRTTANMFPTNGKVVQGAFWHHTLTVDADCSSDPLGKSPDIKTAAEDAVSAIILVAKGKQNLVAVVNVGTNKLNQQTLVEGYNNIKFSGLTPGKVQLEVWDGSTMVGGGYGKLEVTNTASLCNYNFQVVAVPS
ncbi:hypothetical protein E8E13_009042 [Curvularia kusanoi]|uniref:Glycoside hydrolase family 71 protein n=1 Tax=Curvularia kusanoi TaxID=90978 RepID=A0A9P4TP88_CURKU|nr:hypothetical protein E8E13_009042 [Curvularia kusanoi]